MILQRCGSLRHDGPYIAPCTVHGGRFRGCNERLDARNAAIEFSYSSGHIRHQCRRHD